MKNSIQIGDRVIIRRVEMLRRKFGDKSIARTATRLLTERISQMDYEARSVVEQPKSADADIAKAEGRAP